MQRLLISIHQLSKCYNASEGYRLSDVTFDVTAGERFGIFGPNGAGKTTLLSIMCGLTQSTSGTLSYCLNGHVTSISQAKKVIGFVPQDFALYEELTAWHNLEYFGALYNLPRKVVARRSQELLAMLGLESVAKKRVKTFSGGMKRRLNLAAGLIHEPKILFLDEPTVGVDIQSKNAIMSFLKELNAKGTTIIYTSHHMAEAEEFCSKIAILDFGKLIANDTLENLLAKYQASSLMDVLLHLTGKEYRDNV